ncbi:cytochrome c [Spirosomataceae bacterium TFI 002]|nr:cytochrome c [Spirosomataceae bacterium TFI 002]
MRKIAFLLFITLLCTDAWSQTSKVLVFSKTAGFRHSSIEAGQKYFGELGKAENINITFSEDASLFTDENLKTFNAVVFLNTTGDILNNDQQVSFERYIQAGGGFMGIHAAADCEYEWPWYNGLVGAYFASHPGGDVGNVQMGKMNVLDKNHPSTAHLPSSFSRKDEFYDFKSLKKEQLNFLIEVDEKSYKQGKMGDFHPMAWNQNYDGGKVFYTNFGHVDETFQEKSMMEHLKQGLMSVMSEKRDYSLATSVQAPEENRYVKTVLIDNLDEPTELAAMPNGKVIFVERKGAVKVWDPKTNEVNLAAQMPVYTKFEYGLMGVGVDPDFENNNWVYLFYSPETEEHKDQFLSRFEFDQSNNTIKMESEKVVLRFPAKRVECCHTGGSIDWDNKGNLFLSTGDDTNPFASDGYAPIDFSPNRAGWDALRTSGNTNDLRGKILRITPTKDGSYTIPSGNLFPVGMEKTKPEIFVMGCRNPYRIAVDKKTNYLYWGDVGPDAGKAKADRGPDGQVEFNQARVAGNYGWPLFTGDNDAYNAYNFETKESGPKFDPAKPINNSPNNTGLRELPPANIPLVWYGYGVSDQFPLLEKGGANPMGGPVYYSDMVSNNPRKLPSYVDGKFFAYEWMRDWIILIDMDENGNYKSMERFMPNTKFYHPMDMTISKDGELFLLEYGMNWFSRNKEAMLSKIDFNPGNREPVVNITSSKSIGAAPLKVAFNSEGTIDYDGDKLTYEWNFGPKTSNEVNPVYTFKKPGLYDVSLTVKDNSGNSSKKTIQIQVGNEEPKIDITLKGNQSFYFGQDSFDYSVTVNDKEDGTIGKGIKSEDVIVNVNYLEGYDKTMIAQGHQQNLNFSNGKRMIEKNDCSACHSVSSKSIGPSYTDISGKYKNNNSNKSLLATKIINGGGGVWGEQAMAAHPDLAEDDAKAMVEYILSINDEKIKSLPTSATYVAEAHKGKKEGAYLIQATYTDKGGKIVGPLSGTKVVALRNPMLKSTSYDATENTMKFDIPGKGEVTVANDLSILKYTNIDFKGIKKIKIEALGQKGQTVGGNIEFRIGSKDGPLIGEAKVEEDNSSPILVELSNLPDGQKDLVLVFKNAKAEGKPLFAVSYLQFMQ